MEDKIFANTYKKRPLFIKGGSGSYLIEKDGRKYLDFLSGISINNLGYSNRKIQRKIKDQLGKIIHPSNYYSTESQINLARVLCTMSGLGRVFFANSGTEANEAALSFITGYKRASGQLTKKNEIIAFTGSFFGRTYGSQIAALGGAYRDIRFIPVPFNDRKALRDAVNDSTLGIYAELILGHGGIREIDESVVQEIKALCEDKALLLAIDEVQTGLGRAGFTFLFKKFGLKPDLVTLGKSLGGGLPLSATLISDRVANTIQPGDYGCTMGGNSLACAAGSIVLEFLSKQENLTMINQKGEYLLKQLQSIASEYPDKIQEARCYGLMGALELRDGYAAQIPALCMQEGLLLDIVNKNVLRFLPPFIVTYAEIDKAMNALKHSIAKAT